MADLNRVQESIDEYVRALVLDPGNSKVYRQLASVRSRRMEMLEAASRDLDRALLFDPYNPEYLRRRASMHLDRNELDAAKRNLDKALLLGAFDDDVRDQLRRYYWQAGDMDRAVQEAETMITLMPNRSRNWFLYAITLNQSRDCRALEAFENYLRQCLIFRECDERRQQEVTLNIFHLKQACS